MVKMRKGDKIILGLSEMNIKKLKEGMPIKFNLKELHAGDIDVFIFCGKDEQSMALTLKTMTEPIN